MLDGPALAISMRRRSTTVTQGCPKCRTGRAARRDLRAIAGDRPIVVGAVLLVAGILQRTGWRARYIAICCEAFASGLTRSADAGAAWRHGRGSGCTERREAHR